MLNDPPSRVRVSYLGQALCERRCGKCRWRPMSTGSKGSGGSCRAACPSNSPYTVAPSNTMSLSLSLCVCVCVSGRCALPWWRDRSVRHCRRASRRNPTGTSVRPHSQSPRRTTACICVVRFGPDVSAKKKKKTHQGGDAYSGGRLGLVTDGRWSKLGWSARSRKGRCHSSTHRTCAPYNQSRAPNWGSRPVR